MYYDTVEIRPVKGQWIVLHRALDGDRIASKTCTPSASGFFHYPRKWGIERGFEKLKAEMIWRHQQEIEKLTKSIEALKSLQLPNKNS